MKLIIVIIFSCFIFLGLSCDIISPGPHTRIESLGFNDKFALYMIIEEPYLYVCAGSDGLWRMNIQTREREIGNT